ncbi:MAG TPA: ATP-binding cassette domain-containing protein [Cellulomonas sp.]
MTAATTPGASDRRGAGGGAGGGPVWGLDGVTVRRGSRTVLDDVTLTVPSGRVTAVVGGDGAGKSTLARALLGTEAVAVGTVRRPGRREIGAMPAMSGVWGDLSVAENVDLVVGAYGLSRAAARSRSADLLEAAGLTGAQDRLGRRLSGGMRQKLGFCLAMLPSPELLVLDEPSTGVDPVSRVELWRLLSRAAADGTAVLVTTTYLDEAERASQVLVLDRGAVVYTGDPEQAASAVHGTVVVGERSPRAGVPTWRRGPEVHALLPATDPVVADAAARGPELPVVVERTRASDLPVGSRVVQPDLEDAVIALTLERRGTAHVSAAPAPSVQSSTPGTATPATGASGTGAPRTAARTTPSVEVSDVVTVLGGVRAVDGVSLTVRPGRVVGLLGANGAGKTTLIRTVLGLVAPTSGEVRVLGGAPSRDTRRRLGYVPQGLGLAADLSVAENLELVAAAYGLHPAPAVPPDLAEHAGRLVGSLGLGLQRRLAFAAALSHDPELLVLDEPTSGVDPLARAALWDSVHAQAEAGVAVLVTTHYMQEAEQCDELVLLAHGRRVAGGALAEVLAGSRAVRVDAEDWQTAFGALTAAGLPVTVEGRAVRVSGVEPDRVRAALQAAGVAGRVEDVPARLEEVMVLAQA